jgi:pimeloyl-ACP methyl ester carboxylesterase
MLLAMTTMQFLDRPAGRIAYELTGDPGGPLVVCVPGMGDLSSTFRGLAARLAAAGAQVAAVDLRGHGQSSVGWPDYSPAAVAGDLLALVDHLGGRAVLVGNSYGGSAAVIAAGREPAAVAGLVLLGAFVRDSRRSLAQRLQVALIRRTRPGRALWTAVAWPSFFRRRPADFAERRAELKAALARPRGYEALAAMMAAGRHRDTEPLLGRVQAPALVVMGGADPDYPDPAAEARFTAGALGGPATVLMVDGVGHYPQAEAVDDVAPAVLELVEKTW